MVGAKGRILIAAVAVFGILFVLRIVANPLRGGPQQIQNWLLSKTPLGESVDSVMNVISHSGWQRLSTTRFTSGSEIECEIGRYQSSPWPVAVHATWAFDDHRRLMRIDVEKIVDSP